MDGAPGGKSCFGCGMPARLRSAGLQRLSDALTVAAPEASVYIHSVFRMNASVCEGGYMADRFRFLMVVWVVVMVMTVCNCRKPAQGDGTDATGKVSSRETGQTADKMQNEIRYVQAEEVGVEDETELQPETGADAESAADDTSGGENEYDVTGACLALQDTWYQITDSDYMVSGCWEKHEALWKARYNLFKVRQHVDEERLAYLLRSRNPGYLARLLRESAPSFRRRWSGAYTEDELLVEALVSYYRKITSTGDWKKRFDRLLAEHENELDEATVFHAAGFPASNDECMLKSSHREHSLESWFYGFWIRRYRENLFDLAATALIWLEKLIDHELTSADSMDLAGYRLDGDPREQFDEQLRKERAAVFGALHKQFPGVGAESWSGPIYAGYDSFGYNDGSLIVNQECYAGRGDDEPGGSDGDAPRQWTDTAFFKASYGLEPGMVMTAISPDNRLVSVKLTELTCTAGECRGDWWLAGFTVVDDTEGVAQAVAYENSGDGEQRMSTWGCVFPRSVVSPQDSLYVITETSEDTGCTVDGLDSAVPDGMRTICYTYATDPAAGIELQLFRYWYEQENGWPTGTGFIRVKKGRTASSNGKWLKISTRGNGMFPTHMIVRKGTCRILLAASEGISGPANETRMLVEVDGNVLTSGGEYIAGGQPCD